ncbi:ricin-type beta-trefoil lectin domain protein [Streptomyces griseoruber]
MGLPDHRRQTRDDRSGRTLLGTGRHHASGNGNVLRVRRGPVRKRRKREARRPRDGAQRCLDRRQTGDHPADVPECVVRRRAVRGYASGRCIDVTDAGGDGTPLQIWDCNGAPQQKWRFMGDGTVRALGLCMDVAWGATNDGAVIQLATCNGNPAQQFRLNSAHDLVDPQADKCVDANNRGTGNGTRLQLWDCNGQNNQKWGSR